MYAYTRLCFIGLPKARRTAQIESGDEFVSHLNSGLKSSRFRDLSKWRDEFEEKIERKRRLKYSLSHMPHKDRQFDQIGSEEHRLSADLGGVLRSANSLDERSRLRKCVG